MKQVPTREQLLRASLTEDQWLKKEKDRSDRRILIIKRVLAVMGVAVLLSLFKCS